MKVIRQTSQLLICESLSFTLHLWGLILLILLWFAAARLFYPALASLVVYSVGSSFRIVCTFSKVDDSFSVKRQRLLWPRVIGGKIDYIRGVEVRAARVADEDDLRYYSVWLLLGPGAYAAGLDDTKIGFLTSETKARHCASVIAAFLKVPSPTAAEAEKWRSL